MKSANQQPIKMGISERHHSRPGRRKPLTDGMSACLPFAWKNQAPQLESGMLQDETGTPGHCWKGRLIADVVLTTVPRTEFHCVCQGAVADC